MEYDNKKIYDLLYSMSNRRIYEKIDIDIHTPLKTNAIL